MSDPNRELVNRHYEDFVNRGDMAAVLATWSGTHTGSFLGIDPTGRAVEMRGIVLWRVQDGQLAERWAVLDYDTLLGALQAEG